jgi:hypothetical protein
MMLDMTLLPGEQNGVMEDELLVNNTSARPSNVIIIHIIIIILFVTLTPYSYSKVGHRWEPKDSVGPWEHGENVGPGNLEIVWAPTQCPWNLKTVWGPGDLKTCWAPRNLKTVWAPKLCPGSSVGCTSQPYYPCNIIDVLHQL